VEYRTNALGMRTFSSKDARCRILVLGDSFTDAIEVSNDQTFHSIMDERSSCAVFAYGVGGWGNLQEMMALEKLVPVTSPSEVIVQLSGNDIINNSFELEQQSYWNNLAQRRPYLGEDGVIRQRTPYNTPLVSWLRFVPSWVEDNFRIMSFVKYRLLRYAASHHGDDTIEARLMRNREDVPAYQAALAITRQIFDRMTALAPNADFLAFAATTGPMAEDLLAVAKSSGMTIVGGLPEAVEQADKAGTPVYSSDGVHWSVTGHQLVADFLLQRLDAKRIDPLVSLDCETRVDLDSVSP
jgi:lysophospholipase L1-like esterase